MSIHLHHTRALTGTVAKLVDFGLHKVDWLREAERGNGGRGREGRGRRRGCMQGAWAAVCVGRCTSAAGDVRTHAHTGSKHTPHLHARAHTNTHTHTRTHARTHTHTRTHHTAHFVPHTWYLASSSRR